MADAKPKFTGRDGVTNHPKFNEPDRSGWRDATWEGADLAMTPQGAVQYKVTFKKNITAPQFAEIVTLACGPKPKLTNLGKYMFEQAAATAVTKKGKAGPSTQTELLREQSALIAQQTAAISALLAKAGIKTA